jgi:hypothetical protein
MSLHLWRIYHLECDAFRLEHRMRVTSALFGGNDKKRNPPDAFSQNLHGAFIKL